MAASKWGLGERRAAHTHIQQREPARPLPDPRGTVIDDGVELEVVWYAHRDAPSLMTEEADYGPGTIRLMMSEAIGEWE